MAKQSKNCLASKSQESKWILYSVPFLFIIGSLFHFAYDFTGKNIIVGFFTPINESIWEHIKLILTPLLLWWILYYVFKHKKYNINKYRWFNASFFAIITGIILVPALYYLYTGALGIESLVIDVLILFFSILFAQILGYHFYKYLKGINYLVPIILIIIIVIIFIIFTISPPELPIFKSYL